MRANITTHDGKQLAAARALAGLGIRELAAAADIAPRTLHRLETSGVIQVSETKRHGTCSEPCGSGSRAPWRTQVSNSCPKAYHSGRAFAGHSREPDVLLHNGVLGFVQ